MAEQKFLTNLDVAGTIDLNNLTINSAQGTDGQVLTSTGSGIAWEDASGGASLSGGAANKLAIWSGTDALTNDTNLHWDTSNDRLGIGTATPANTLHVNGRAVIGSNNTIGSSYVTNTTIIGSNNDTSDTGVTTSTSVILGDGNGGRYGNIVVSERTLKLGTDDVITATSSNTSGILELNNSWRATSAFSNVGGFLGYFPPPTSSNEYLWFYASDNNSLTTSSFSSGNAPEAAVFQIDFNPNFGTNSAGNSSNTTSMYFGGNASSAGAVYITASNQNTSSRGVVTIDGRYQNQNYEIPDGQKIFEVTSGYGRTKFVVESGGQNNEASIGIQKDIFHLGDTNTFFGFTGADTFGVTTGGTERLSIGNSGATFSGSVTGSSFVKSGGTSSQFLKADGSVDSSTYLTAHPNISAASSSDNSGRTYIQDITLDSNGHVTGIATATETVTAPTVNNGQLTVQGTGALGGSGTFTANQSGNTTISISHDDTSSQGSVDNSNGTVIQDVTLDGYGHVTALGSVNLDGRYYTETESDNRFVNETGDTMTGQLNMHAGAYEGSITFGSSSTWRCGIRQHDDADAELRIWAKNTNGMIFLTTGYDGEPANISRPTDGLVVVSNNVGIGNFSSGDPSYKLHTKGDIYANGGWLRVSGNQGLYFQSHGGGWYMTDSTWIRSYNNKSIYHNSGTLRTDGTFQVGSSGATFQAVNGGAVTINGSTVWHAGNDGSGSTLDADLLDGQHGSYYDHRGYTVDNNYLGGYYVSGGTEKPNDAIFGSGKFKVAMLRGGSNNLGFGGTWNDVFWLSSYNGGDVKKSVALVSSKYDSTSLWIAKQDYDSSSWGTGYLFWNSGNDGSGSGLDADKLDNLHADSFLRSDTADTATGIITINNDLYVGTYSGTTQARLFLNGTTANKQAKLQCTNGNLHIDSEDGHSLYLNYYEGTTDNVIIGNGNGGASGTILKSTGRINAGEHVIANNNVYSGAGYFVFGTSTSEGEYIARSSDTLTFYSGGAIKFDITPSNGVHVRNGTSYFAQISNSGHGRFANDVVAFYNFSDKRLKTNIKPTTDNLDKVLKLNPVEYNWKEGYRKDKKEIGLIAQEVEKIIPEVVRENQRLNDDTLYKQVDYEHLVSTLIGAVQEQQKQIDELKSIINGRP